MLSYVLILLFVMLLLFVSRISIHLLNNAGIYLQVRIEAALTLRSLAEVDPTCVGGLTSFGVTTLNALRDSVSFDKVVYLKMQPATSSVQLMPC